MRFASPALPLAGLILFCSIQAFPAAQPTVVMPATMNVAPDATVTLSVALSTPAPPGGVTITLSSSNPSIASVWPPSMVIPMEMTTPPRLIPIVTGHLSGTTTITAAVPGYTTANMVVQAGTSGGGGGNTGTGSISLMPANLSVAKGSSQTLTVVLSSDAPAGGVAVNLSCSDATVVSAPATVTVAAGTTAATVPVTGLTAGSATITAGTTNFGTATASVVVSGTGGPPASPAIIVPSSLTLAPGDVREYRIELVTAAPASGVYLTATTSDASKVTLSQSSIFIPEGMTSVPRKVTTVNAMSSGVAAINVSAAGYASVNTQVQVTGSITPPAGGTMSLSPSSLSMSTGETKVLTLSLSSPAGNGGVAVSLNSSNSSVASVSSAVTVGAGTATYNIQVTGPGAGSATITATAANYGSATANVTVSSASAPPPSQAAIIVPASLALMPGETVPFSVALPSGAGSNGVPITLTSSDPDKASVSPSTYVIPAGATTSRRVETTLRGTSVGSVTITASASGFGNGTTQVQVKSSAAGGTMAVAPAALSLITGSTQNLTLTLNGTLPPKGLVIYVTSDNTAAATVPSSVTLPVNATIIPVPVAAVGTGTATITATAANFGSAAAVVTVAATPQINLPSNVTLAAGETVNFPVTLSAAALSDMVISLNSSDTSKLTVAPPSVTILKGMTSAPNVTTTVSGVNAGTATVTATSPGYTGASGQVVVTPASNSALTMGLSPANLSITGLITQNLTLTLSGPAPAGGLAVTFTSSNGSNASVPSTLTVPANTSSIAVPVTARATGTTVVTANSAGLQNATATVTVLPVTVGALTIPASWTVSPGQSNTLQVTLSPAAPSSGVTLTFASSDTSKATVTPGSITLGGGGTSATVQITGIAAGTANISASAPGYTGASTPVQVFVATGSGAFDPGILAINSGVTQTVSLGLGPQSPAGLTVNLISSDPFIAKVPATVVVPANSYQVSVPVTAVAAGSAVITATVPGYANSTLHVTVLSFDGVSVEWHGICWVPVVYQGVTYYRHAIDFKLTTPQPVTLQGSLFYTSSDCSGPVDNMNDFGTTTSSTHMIQGFVNYPYPIWPAASVLFWIGPRTADGKCPAGSLCTGCLAYSDKTPMCDSLP